MAKQNELLTRAVSEVVPGTLAEEKLKAGKPLRIYMGIDPTGSKLHIGHGVPLKKLQQFCDAGHHVIFLIGSYTAMIGDPTGRNEMRKPLTKEQVEENFSRYKQQASKILDFSRVEIRFNHEWLEKLRGEEIFNIMRPFTIAQVLQRDMFKERMKKGEDITPDEFLYPLLQGYDSVVLDVDCEIGGNDQLFNMLCGRKLQKAFGKREKFVMTMKLLEGTDGRKMSKTYDNCIFFEDEPNVMFGKIMSINDDLMQSYFELCTDIELKEVRKILQGNPRDAKVRLSKEIVTLYHGADAAKKAEAEFQHVHKEKGVPEDIEEVKVKKGTLLVDVLVERKLIASKSEARRLIEQKGIHVNDSVVDSLDAKAAEGIVKVGKRKFLRIHF